MVEKKVIKKTTDQEKVQKYWQAIGRRKSSVASVRLFESKEKEPKIIINSKNFNNYFPVLELQKIVLSPLKAVEDVSLEAKILVNGGGIRGQAEATRHGIARALVRYNQDLKKQLKDLGFLTRDARKKERKKPGLKKARRAPQFSKR